MLAVGGMGLAVNALKKLGDDANVALAGCGVLVNVSAEGTYARKPAGVCVFGLCVSCVRACICLCAWVPLWAHGVCARIRARFCDMADATLCMVFDGERVCRQQSVTRWNLETRVLAKCVSACCASIAWTQTLFGWHWPRL